MTEYLLSAGICMAIVSILLIGMAISNVSKGQYAKRFFFFATSCLVLTLVVVSSLSSSANASQTDNGVNENHMKIQQYIVQLQLKNYIKNLRH